MPPKTQSDGLTPSYCLLWRGQVPLPEVTWSYSPARVVRYSPSQQRDIDRHWETLLASGRRYTSQPIYRLAGFKGTRRSLHLELGLTFYKEYHGTNVARPAWALADPSLYADPLAMSAVVVTKDGYVLLQERSAISGEYPGMLHVTPSGHLQPPSSLVEGVLAELHEELAVQPEELAGDLQVIALVLNTQIHKPELVLHGHMGVTAGEVLARRPKDAWEYNHLLPLEWRAQAVKRWLVEHQHDAVPPGHAALLLAAAHEFEDPWFEERVRPLEPASPP